MFTRNVGAKNKTRVWKCEGTTPHVIETAEGQYIYLLWVLFDIKVLHM